MEGLYVFDKEVFDISEKTAKVISQLQRVWFLSHSGLDTNVEDQEKDNEYNLIL